jgi:hypothetical protein
MRVQMSVAVLAAAALLATGCGSVKMKMPPGGNAPIPAAPATSRISVTTVIQGHGGPRVSSIAGEFDYAHARGELRMTLGGGVTEEEVFLPGHVYLKLPGGGKGLPGGKTWLVVTPTSPDSLPFMAPVAVPAGSPAGLLASLTAVASRVQDLGPATVGGVPVTHYRLTLDPAKAGSLGRGHGPARLGPIFAAPGMSRPRVDVWADGQRVVRRITFAVAFLPGAPPGAGRFQLTETVDYYDFGVPVRVSPPPSPPPAGEVFGGSAYPGTPAYASRLAVTFGSSISSAGGGFFSSTAPPVSGTLTTAQAASAGQAVRSFWAALGSGDLRAAAQSVTPSQRRCFLLALSHAVFRVSALRIMSAKPAGTARATVWFTASARIKIGGNGGPVLPPGQNGANWMVASSIGGRWYVDLRDSGTAMDFAPLCR